MNCKKIQHSVGVNLELKKHKIQIGDRDREDAKLPALLYFVDPEGA